MSQVIEILRSLGINDTVFFQFGIFFIAYISMSYIVFKPYLRAYEERVKRTIGGQEDAAMLLYQADEKEAIYKEEAKKLNAEIRTIFSERNNQAKKEVEEILTEAKGLAEAESEAAKKELELSVSQARKEMENFIPEISQNIQKKFMGQ